MVSITSYPMVPTVRPTYKQHLAWQAFQDALIAEIFFGGGAGGGKSWWLCETRLFNAYRYPGYKSFIAREELKRLMQSTYVTFTKVCKYHHIPEKDWKLNGQYNYIEFANGSRIDLIDAKYLPGDPLYERFGSLEYSDGAFEEAGEIDFLAFDVLKSRVNRHLNDELGIIPNVAVTGNPKKNWTYSRYYKRWKNKELPANIAFIQALYSDNEYAAKSYDKTLSGIEDKAIKARLRDGNWEYDSDPSTLMDYDTITDLFTNEVEFSEQKYMIVDAARFGGDKIVLTFWKGLLCYKILWKVRQGIDNTEDWIKDEAAKEMIPRSHILIDEDGVGGGLVDNIKGSKGFVANRVPFDENGKKPNYRTLKDQCGYKLAKLANERKIGVRTDDLKVREDMIEELEQIKSFETDKDKPLRLLPKEDVKEIICRSPDFSDCLLMRMYFEVRPPERNGGVARSYTPNYENQNYGNRKRSVLNAL